MKEKVMDIDRYHGDESYLEYQEQERQAAYEQEHEEDWKYHEDRFKD